LQAGTNAADIPVCNRRASNRAQAIADGREPNCMFAGGKPDATTSERTCAGSCQLLAATACA